MDSLTNGELLSRLWSWSVHTGDPLYAEAAGEIVRLNSECMKLAGYLMSEYTWVHEYRIAEVDEALAPYLGNDND